MTSALRLFGGDHGAETRASATRSARGTATFSTAPRRQASSAGMLPQCEEGGAHLVQGSIRDRWLARPSPTGQPGRLKASSAAMITSPAADPDPPPITNLWTAETTRHLRLADRAEGQVITPVEQGDPLRVGLHFLDVDPAAKAACPSAARISTQFTSGLLAAALMIAGQREPGLAVEGVDRRHVEHDLGDAVRWCR